MNTALPSEILFTAAEVAKASGVDEISLRAFEPEGFGSPGHWRMVGGQVVYTARGVELLVASLDANKLPVAAHSLRVFHAQRVSTPALALPRKATREPYYRQGSLA